MKIVGELCLLVAFVGSGFATFVHLTQSGRHREVYVPRAPPRHC